MLGPFRMSALSGIRMTVLEAWLYVASNTLLFLSEPPAFTGDRPQPLFLHLANGEGLEEMKMKSIRPKYNKF